MPANTLKQQGTRPDSAVWLAAVLNRPPLPAAVHRPTQTPPQPRQLPSMLAWAASSVLTHGCGSTGSCCSPTKKHLPGVATIKHLDSPMVVVVVGPALLSPNASRCTTSSLWPSRVRRHTKSRSRSHTLHTQTQQERGGQHQVPTGIGICAHGHKLEQRMRGMSQHWQAACFMLLGDQLASAMLWPGCEPPHTRSHLMAPCSKQTASLTVSWNQCDACPSASNHPSTNPLQTHKPT